MKDFRNDAGCVDPDTGKMTVEAPVGRYLASIQHQVPATVRKKKGFAAPIFPQLRETARELGVSNIDNKRVNLA